MHFFLNKSFFLKRYVIFAIRIFHLLTIKTNYQKMKVTVSQLLVLVFILNSGFLTGQNVFKGKVTSSESGLGLRNANIQVEDMAKSATTDANGFFELDFEEKTSFVLVVSHIGHATLREEFTPEAFGKLAEIMLRPEVFELEDVTIAATRSRQKAIDYPARINLLNNKRVNEIPALSADELLRAIPGVSVSRGASFLSSSTVSLRGMGSEQGRTLVLVDGVPVNKTDGGSVNWNAINTADIHQVEVIKGPGSSIYGGNAMGGIINMTTPVPEEGLHGDISQSYGTFNTLQTQAGISGNNNKLFWGINGTYRTSDGYITTPADEVDEYTEESFLDEQTINGRFGYFVTPDQTIEIAGGYYSGKRGTGANFTGYGFENEELASEDGSYNHYQNINGRLLYSRKLNTRSHLDITLYGQRENYQNIRENLRNERITRYDVESIRSDVGLLSTLNFQLGNAHSITTGIDIKNGGVDGNDIYITSTDKVINLGKMLLTGIYVQDEIVLFNPKWQLLAGLRYDYAGFYDGSFVVENPTNETLFLQDFEEDLPDADFNAISPRISVQYHEPQKYRIYMGYSRGFRAPVLDDMCRTGRISGGMKLANPDLKPEYLDNVEIGGDLFAGKMITISPTVYYSKGTDYHAYIATGDSLVLNNRLRPIRIKDNIGKVDIIGIELAAGIDVTENINLSLAYSHINTEIIEYKRFDDELDDDLVGKALVYQPTDIFHASMAWDNRFVNLYLSYHYKGAQWLNDINTEEIDAFGNIDLHLWRPVYAGLSASLKVHNLLDEDYVDSRNIIAPGRMITATLKFSF
jgi:outer membrane receptor protein involved in Fe transport